MRDEWSECPAPATPAALDKGTLSKDEEAITNDHLFSCEACKRCLSAVRFDLENDAIPPMRAIPLQQRRWQWPWVAAASLASVLALQTVRLVTPTANPINTLVQAASHEGRVLEPRLSGGFPWAPVRGVTRSGEAAIDAGQMRLIGAAGNVLNEMATEESIEAKHAVALAHLLADRPAECAELLKPISLKANDAGIWSDLAAALYATSVRRDDAAVLAEALAAADRALRIDHDFREALFNRALIIERLGLRDAARAAWERYLAVDDDSGWALEAREHLRVLAPMTNDPRLHTKFHERARDAALRRDWAASVSFFGMELDLLLENGDDNAAAEILLARASVHKRMGDGRAAVQDLARVSEIIRGIKDVPLREHAEADRLAVEGTLASSPAEAVRLLNRAIEFHRSTEHCVHVPEMYLQRARALAAVNEPAKAAADLDAGIRHIELQPGKGRWETTLAREELFEEALTSAVSRGDATRAFAYAEQARMPQVKFSTKTAVSAAPNDVIIEYATLATRLVIFVIRDGRIEAVQSEIGREALAGEITRLTTSVQQRNTAQFRQAASILYHRLVAPVADLIVASRTIVFVPDAALSSVPFSALVAPNGRYVVEDHSVAVAPSATTFAHLAALRHKLPDSRDLLLVTGPSLGNADLPSVKREADAIAAVYGSRAKRAQRNLDISGLEENAAAADIIHFAGHGIVSDNGVAALVTSSEGESNGLLTAHDIAAMRLLRTRLVVLAACSTGRIRESGGDQNLSIARAFLVAGVPSVIATLWPIEDAASAEFFLRLHQHLDEGTSPSVALRATQLEWLRRADLRAHAPAIWAAVQVVGI